MMSLNKSSVRTVKIGVKSTTLEEMPSATGFFCSKNGKTYLVTNWHVVTGIDRFTGNELIFQKRPFLLSLKCEFTKKINAREFKHFEKSIEINLYESLSGEGVPCGELWVEHKDIQIDDVVIDISSSIADITNPSGESVETFDLDCEIEQPHIQVMDEVFIAGFPLNSKLTHSKYPIYKYATVASEQDTTDDLPIFLVDGKTRSGMSGGPVIHRERANIKIDTMGLQTFSEGKQTLIGIYSGRYPGEDEYSAELGICWKLEECLVPLLKKE